MLVEPDVMTVTRPIPAIARPMRENQCEDESSITMRCFDQHRTDSIHCFHMMRWLRGIPEA